MYKSPSWKPLKVDMEVPTETDQVTFDIHNSTTSNFNTSVNATNGAYYNATETAPTGVITIPYLAQDGPVDVYDRDGVAEVGDGYEEANDKLLHIILPLSVFAAIGLFGLAVYLYRSMKKSMNEAIRSAVASLELENSRKSGTDDGNNPHSFRPDSVSLKTPSAAHIKDNLDTLSAHDSLKDIEKNAFDSFDSASEEVVDTKFSSKAGKAWQWAASKLRGRSN
ncbi:hypothetical protein V1525DRAFT_396020 [Lipomyces kononenkoae]|uniref:Uncharacterized protein n=1 Tax=Lipomyces kononenkoae TaxID=34357 RepID=A0ACC3T818_LIPKO